MDTTTRLTRWMSFLLFFAGLLVGCDTKAQLTWTERNATTTETLYGAIFANSKFYLDGSGLDLVEQKIITSPNGNTWSALAMNRATIGPASFVLQAVTPQVVAFGNGIFVTYNSGQILKSSDHVTWNPIVTPGGFSGVCNPVYNGSGFGVLAGFITSCSFYHSNSTGSTWTETNVTLPANTSLGNCLAFGNGVYVAAFDGSGGSVLGTSKNGSTWTVVKTVAQQVKRIAYANGAFVAVGTQGLIVNSLNGTTWTSVTSPGSYADLKDAAFGKNTWVIVGACGTILSSINNGVSWTRNNSGTGDNFETVTFGGTTFLAAGENGLIEQSN